MKRRLGGLLLGALFVAACGQAPAGNVGEVTFEPITHEAWLAKLELMTVPAVYVYAPDGTLYRQLTADHPDRQFTEEDVERTILELLGEKVALEPVANADRGQERYGEIGGFDDSG